MEKKDPPKLYDNDSSSETSSLASDESLIEVTGPNFADFARQLAFDRTDGYGANSYFTPYEKGAIVERKSEGTYVFPSTILEKQEPPKTTDLTTIYLVDSMNRDRNAFPQPTSLTLKLPRVYRNVKSIQMSQVKLLCSFYYFSTAKSNIYLPITEKGREKITTFNGSSLTKKITIRQGTYGINDLLSEIQTEMNYTPVFYDFPNGFADFIKIFTISGDFSINFNQPGDTYYDLLNSKYIQNPTMATIVSYYWGSRYAGLLDYTLDQLKVAYYYPVLYQVLLDLGDKTARPFLNINAPTSILSEGETVYSHLIFNMSGINDSVALYVINQNLAIKQGDTSILDIYRLNHTFRYSLVNRYQVAYDTNSLQVNFITTSLNTSLVNLINNTGTSALTSILTNLGLTQATYSALQNTVGKSAVIYSDMFQFLQTQLAQFLGIPYATYASQYFNNIANTIYFQDGLSASGIRTGYTLEYLTSGQTPLTSMVNSFSNSPGYWPNLNTLNGYQGFNPANINPAQSMYPYNAAAKNFQFNISAIDPTNYFINTYEPTRTVDLMVKILPAQYTVFKFKSAARQTLQVETLPLPYYYRYADYNAQGLYTGILDENKNNMPQKYFDLSYNFVYNATNKNMDIANYSKRSLNPIFGQPFQDSFLAATPYNVNSQTNYYHFEFIAPYPPGISTGLCVNNTSLSIVPALGNISTIFTDTFSAFLYHDRGVYMADLQFPRAENPLHYIQTQQVDTTKSSLTMNFSTFSGHTYYTIFRSNNLSCSNVSIKPFVYYNDSSFTQIKTDYTNFDPNANPYALSNLSTADYVTNYNTDFTRLPTSSTLMGPDPTSSTFNVSLTLQGLPIGYDISGVSNDLTDYMGYNYDIPGFDPTTQFRIDPLSYYIFQYVSPFNQVKGTYFDSRTQNSLLEPITNNTYIFKGTSTSQAKIVHWYDGYSIPIQTDDAFTTFKTIGFSQTSTITQDVPGFPQDSSGNIIFGRGVKAIGFLPNDGVFEVNSFSFKSSVYPLTSVTSTNEDPNLKIKYIGVFSGTSLVNSLVTLTTALTVLKFTKSVPYGPATATNTPGFGSGYGTWYQFDYDPTFVQSAKKVSGYTPLPSEILSYNAMYYMVPFSADGLNLTYSLLSGSILPYPLAQRVSTGSTFFGQVAENITQSSLQPTYVMPIPLSNANPAYGPQGIYSQTQSQYQQSIPITTTSIGYKELPLIVDDENAPYPFRTSFPIQLSDVSLITFFSEYSDTLYTVNAASQICSNVAISFPCATYASSISTVLNKANITNTDCMRYLVNPAAPLQNTPLTGTLTGSSVFTFSTMRGDDSNITMNSIQIHPSWSNITLWMWGGGGGTWENTSSITGGAGAYVKVNINANALRSISTPDSPLGISTLYLVVGKGGNRDNVRTIETVGALQLYEQPRYGGGGTSLMETFVNENSIYLQGGGFSGIFASPNLMTATPLLIVGGGGAAGSINLGGPGGFAATIAPQPIISFDIEDAVFSGIYYDQNTELSIQDAFTNSTSTELITDGDLKTFWNPVFPGKLNPTNYFPTPNTYGLTLNFQAPLAKISKIRYYGPPIGNTRNLPTGIIVYNNQNKTQVLFSNTSIDPSEFDLVDNGQFTQQIYEIIPSMVTATTLNQQGYIVGGVNSSTQNSIQYSLNGTEWIPTNNIVLETCNTVLYVPLFNKWFAVGTGVDTSAPIASSTDGLTWTPCSINGFTGTSLTAMAFGLNTIILGGNNGQLFFSTDGLTWNPSSSRFSSRVTRIRFINGMFWALGGTDAALRRSLNGLTWTSVLAGGTVGVNDIAFGLGRYVITQTFRTPPYNSGLIYSNDGVSWLSVSPVNIGGFSGLSVIFASNTFVATGKTIDSTSFIKYSIDGINWLNSSLPISGDFPMDDIQYLGSKFIVAGATLEGTGKAANQLSLITSLDGRTWAYSKSGGFDPDVFPGAQGNSSGYGPLTIVQDSNPSSLYMEIYSGVAQPQIYEIRVYDSSIPIDEANDSTPLSLDPLIDGDPTTVFYPSELQTIDVVEYPFSFTLSQQAQKLNIIQIVLPHDTTVLFTGLVIDFNDTVVYSNLDIAETDFADDTDTYIYNVLLVPTLVNVTEFNLTFYKATENSLQISDINVAYDPNYITTLIPSSVADLGNRATQAPSLNIATITDTNLATFWSPTTFITGDSVKLTFTFSPKPDRINHIQIINGDYPPTDTNAITGIYIYTDFMKTTLLYSNTTFSFTQYQTYSMIDLDIPPLVKYSSIYMELSKSKPGPPLINAIHFYNIGVFQNSPNGFSAGQNILSLNQSIKAASSYDGGGGSEVEGGLSGPAAYKGDYLTGGSPAILKSLANVSTTTSIVNGSGGGGGGYYGGGGGGILINGNGGAGGGGSGYIYTNDSGDIYKDTSGNPIFVVEEYGVAIPDPHTTPVNYNSPGLVEQESLINSLIVEEDTVNYGQGGVSGIDSGQGGHGLIVITYDYTFTGTIPGNSQLIPSFIDGSKLTLAQSPIDYSSQNRALAFANYSDPIQYTEYADFNWVWYSSYLSLIGLTLLPPTETTSFEPSDTTGNFTVANESFPSLTNELFTQLSETELFTEIQELFANGFTATNVVSIISTIQDIFESYQATFVTISYTDVHYEDYTEVYCLLEYLQTIANLQLPHLDPANPRLDRILGGVPRFGYWANPFLVSASYIGFDVTMSQIPSSAVSDIVSSSEPVQAIYGLVMEMSLKTGAYEFKDIMTYKPSLQDSSKHGQDWLIITQFPEGYITRSLSSDVSLTSNIPVQPYTFKNAISARLPLFKYSVYTTPSIIESIPYNIPVQIINDFEGPNIYLYCFQNTDTDNQSTISISQVPLTSTILEMNQLNITNQGNANGPFLGTLVSEYTSTIVQGIDTFGFDGKNYIPRITYSTGGNFFNTFSTNALIYGSSVGKGIVDQYGNYFFADNQGSKALYQNVGTSVIQPVNFQKTNTPYNSPKYILSQYDASVENPPSDFFVSKYTNIWHVPTQGNITSLSGVRLTSPFDFTEVTNFVNQVFYPTHKITLTKKGTLINPILNTGDTQTYPSYQHTQMFFYKNYSTMVNDIGGKFAMETTTNFANMDMLSGFGFNSYMYNINLSKTTNTDNNQPDSFNYLAIRAYSPSETFQSLVRFYLPQRYDFGYISLRDLSNEQLTISTSINVNPDYRNFLGLFNASFSTTRNYGAVGFPGFSGSNISTTSFGDFLTQFNTMNTTNAKNAAIISTVTGQSNAAIQNLITGDLQYILPSYLANRNRTTDPLEFSIPFSSCVTPSNASVKQYGIGYNLGFGLQDTPFTTVQRATSFFKILDDYIYLQLNQEFGMNKMDVSMPENFAQTHDTTAQSGMYNSKLMLNTFGSFATTFVQSPVTFNPPLGKIDTLSFNWYDANGVLLNNNDCDWSGSVQIVEAVTASP